ncbi:arylsulfatase A-like enzyme [Bradyrhizobium sp. LM6.10]
MATLQPLRWTNEGRSANQAGLRQQKAIAPDKPFFVYFAPGATHAPHQAPKEWIAKFKGKFDMGWDKLREQTLARQIELGIATRRHQARSETQGHPGLGHAQRR